MRGDLGEDGYMYTLSLAQRHVAAWMQGEFRGGWIHVYVVTLLWT